MNEYETESMNFLLCCVILKLRQENISRKLSNVE